MIINLSIGRHITPLRFINRTMVSNWKFGKECADIGGGIMPGAELKVVDLSIFPGQMWVKVQILSSDPPSFLKISGEEYANNFRALS